MYLARKGLAGLTSLAVCLVGSFCIPSGALANEPGQTARQAGNDMPGMTQTGGVMTLADLESLALKNNPTVAQAEAAVRAAQGRRLQAGLFPNPVIGYEGDEFAFRAFTDKSEHFFFVEQSIPLGGKLGKSRRVFEQQSREEEGESSAQRQRVLNAVRVLYYEALGAQQQVDLRTELAKVAREATETTTELMNVGQADRPDFIEAQIEAEQVELELDNAKSNLAQVWEVLAAVAGKPEMQPVRLAGNLDDEIPMLDQASVTTSLLNDSPEILIAKASVERANAALVRAKAERVPDMFIRGGIGYSTELLDLPSGSAPAKTGPEAEIQIGFNLPIFNRNQGGIAAAEAELAMAQREVDRVSLMLRAKIAQAFSGYETALTAVRRYREVILPGAQKAYEMYLAKYKQMAASYPQVLIAQRTMFQARENYVATLVKLRTQAVHISGFLLTGGLDSPMDRKEMQPASLTGAMPDASAGHALTGER